MLNFDFSDLPKSKPLLTSRVTYKNVLKILFAALLFSVPAFVAVKFLNDTLAGQMIFTMTMYGLPIVLGILAYDEYRSHKKSLHAFKLKNSLQDFSPDSTYIPPSLLSSNLSGKYLLEPGVILNTDNAVLKMFNYIELYEYNHTLNKNGARTILCFEIPALLPHILLNATNVRRFDLYSTQRISLEGDFDKYFSLFGPQDKRIEVLSIITPDVMAKLIDYGRKFDIELSGNKIWIVAPGNVLNKKELPDSLQFADFVAEEMRHKSFSLSAQSNSNLPVINNGTGYIKTRKKISSQFILYLLVISVNLILLIWILKASDVKLDFKLNSYEVNQN